MKLLFDLSKELPYLPTQEIFAVIETYHLESSIIYTDENVLILEIKGNSVHVSELTTRLACTHSISKFLFMSKVDKNEIKKHAKQHCIPPTNSIAIRYKNRSRQQDSQEIVKTLASMYTKDKRVDLEQPDKEIFTVITDSTIFVGLRLSTINRKQYEKRKVQHRPFFSPISIHPRLARTLINLSHVKQDDIVYDPFCGTGGFLIEAALIGCSIIGSDIKREMIEGTQKNLSEYNINPMSLFISDVGDIADHIHSAVDAIVTDAPYGKSTTTNNESLQSLYNRTFQQISNVIKVNGRVIIGLPNKQYIDMFKHYFSVEDIITVPVHRSLTRFFYIGINNQP